MRLDSEFKGKLFDGPQLNNHLSGRRMFSALPGGALVYWRDVHKVLLSDDELATSIVGINSGSFVPLSVGSTNKGSVVVQVREIRSLFIYDDPNVPNCSLAQRFDQISENEEIKRFMTTRSNLLWYQFDMDDVTVRALLPDLSLAGEELPTVDDSISNVIIAQEAFYGFIVQN